MSILSSRSKPASARCACATVALVAMGVLREVPSSARPITHRSRGMDINVVPDGTTCPAGSVRLPTAPKI